MSHSYALVYGDQGFLGFHIIATLGKIGENLFSPPYLIKDTNLHQELIRPIITLTANPALDKGPQIKQINPDQKLRCQWALYEPGGGGINVSRTLRRLAGKST